MTVTDACSFEIPAGEKKVKGRKKQQPPILRSFTVHLCSSKKCTYSVARLWLREHQQHNTKVVKYL